MRAASVDILQRALEQALKDAPLAAIQSRVKQKLEKIGVKISRKKLEEISKRILSGEEGEFHIEGADTDIEFDGEDADYVIKAAEHFYTSKIEALISQVADDLAEGILGDLKKSWPQEAKLQISDMNGFRERLERRWGGALSKLRLLLTIARELGQDFAQRTRSDGEKIPHLDDVLTRLHARACQVFSEIVVLLENGYADGAMARWRTLHEIGTVAAVIAKHGENIAERYVHYQIVESKKAAGAYEANREGLGSRPLAKRTMAKMASDYRDALKKFGKVFGDEYGWAAHHLGKDRITFAMLEAEAESEVMRSHYKMASYNVHATPKGIFFKLSDLGKSRQILAGASNAGLFEPAQNASLSLMKISILLTARRWNLDNVVAGKMLLSLHGSILKELQKADKKLRRDDRRYRSQI